MKCHLKTSLDELAASTCQDIGSGKFISLERIKQALAKDHVDISKLDILLLYTNHLRKANNTPLVHNGPGLTSESAEWVCSSGIRAFGIDALAPGVRGKSNKAVHEICGRTKITHYEGLVNLHLLIGQGIFKFIGLPLKISAGTGSPVRAVAVFN